MKLPSFRFDFCFIIAYPAEKVNHSGKALTFLKHLFPENFFLSLLTNAAEFAIIKKTNLVKALTETVGLFAGSSASRRWCEGGTSGSLLNIIPELQCRNFVRLLSIDAFSALSET